MLGLSLNQHIPVLFLLFPITLIQLCYHDSMLYLLKISFKTNLHHLNDQNLLAYSGESWYTSAK